MILQSLSIDSGTFFCTIRWIKLWENILCYVVHIIGNDAFLYFMTTLWRRSPFYFTVPRQGSQTVNHNILCDVIALRKWTLNFIFWNGLAWLKPLQASWNCGKQVPEALWITACYFGWNHRSWMKIKCPAQRWVGIVSCKVRFSASRGNWLSFLQEVLSHTVWMEAATK